MTDSSTQGIKIVLHPVTDLERAKVVYTALLGIPPQADSSYYVGFDVAGQHIGLVPSGGPQSMTSPVAYWHVPDIEAKLAEVTAAGATLKEAARDVGGGRLVARHRPRRQCPWAASGPMTADPAPHPGQRETR
jgi:predicted enzyme related to lactoylglutathione lyase